MTLSARTFIDMGPNWAQASSAPFRLFKSFTTQGGIKSPMIAKLPGKMVTRGQWNHAFLHLTAIMPTFLEVAIASYPKSLNGRVIKQPIRYTCLYFDLRTLIRRWLSKLKSEIE